jgi:hypothetical protein
VFLFIVHVPFAVGVGMVLGDQNYFKHMFSNSYSKPNNVFFFLGLFFFLFYFVITAIFPFILKKSYGIFLFIVFYICNIYLAFFTLRQTLHELIPVPRYLEHLIIPLINNYTIVINCYILLVLSSFSLLINLIFTKKQIVVEAGIGLTIFLFIIWLVVLRYVKINWLQSYTKY